MRRYFIYSGRAKRVFIFLPYGHSEEKNKSSFCLFEYMISLMHIGWGDYLSRARRDFWRLLIRAAPFSIFGDIDMKRTLKQSQEELKEFMAFIRRLPSFINENTWQISIQRCSQWGVYVRVYPSGYYPWWDELDMNYFQSWANCHEWNVTIRCYEGVPVAEFRTRL